MYKVKHADIFNFNGILTTAETIQISRQNGAFLYGIGLFETMVVRDSKVNHLSYHWERLTHGMSMLRFKLLPNQTIQWFESEIIKTVSINNLSSLCRVRFQVFPTGGGLYNTGSIDCEYVVECSPITKEFTQFNEQGLVVGLALHLRKSIDNLSNLKTTSALLYAIGAQQAFETGWDDSLIINNNGNIIESTTSNVFWVKNELIYTPPLSDGCIAGVMRRHILKNNTVIEKFLSIDEILNADEVFLTNAVRGIRWVREINNRHYRNDFAKLLYYTNFE